MALQQLVPSFTKEEIDDKIEEYVGLGIIERCENGEYVLTPKGWDIWNKCLMTSQTNNYYGKKIDSRGA